MSTTLLMRIRSLVAVVALVSPSIARAQAVPSAAPVPGQIIAAKRMFISNAGSESYGAGSYFSLTRYDGGVDRFYNQFYAAMKQWGHYELADAPADADIVGSVRFLSPIVSQIVDRHVRSEPVYDPQLNVTILDSKTRVALWSLTEHIEPARTKEDDNRHFDEAVARIVDRTRMLASGSTLSSVDGRMLSIYDAAPYGAVDFERRKLRTAKIGGGVLFGAFGGAALAAIRWGHDGCAAVPGCDGPAQPGATAGPMPKSHALEYALTGAAAGGLIGLLWASVSNP